MMRRLVHGGPGAAIPVPLIASLRKALCGPNFSVPNESRLVTVAAKEDGRAHVTPLDPKG
jgi:hypothetical protein